MVGSDGIETILHIFEELVQIEGGTIFVAEVKVGKCRGKKEVRVRLPEYDRFDTFSRRVQSGEGLIR